MRISAPVHISGCYQQLKMKTIQVISIHIFCILIVLGCKRPTNSNNKETCKLTINSDSTYTYNYPNFLNSKPENGTYRLYRDSLVLLRKHYPKIESVGLGYTCWKDSPDTLILNFKNLYKEIIQVTVSINNNLKKYKTNSNGQIEILYPELEKQNVISVNDKISIFNITYGKKEYLMDMEYYKDSRKPDRLDFTLNQFIGEDYAILKRKYKINGDTVFINDISRKIIGMDNKMIMKEKKAGNTIYSK